MTKLYVKELKYRLFYVFLGGVTFFFVAFEYKEILILFILPIGLEFFVSSILTDVFFVCVQFCLFFNFKFWFCLFCCSIGIVFFCLDYIGVKSKGGGLVIKILVFIYIPSLFLHLPFYLSSFLGYFFFIQFKFSWANFEPNLTDYLNHARFLIKSLNFAIFITLFLVYLQYRSKNLILAKYRSGFFFFFLAFSCFCNAAGFSHSVLYRMSRPFLVRNPYFFIQFVRKV
uniref:SecY-independent transporter protein n=1 Tax=Ishige okamurae TaxID=233772 RepID=UPI002E791D97|nr:SecY-independent transporter protein [Ishige okamurae]WBP70192.1 SecY-independent transporter protein [Ishige okamurae]